MNHIEIYTKPTCPYCRGAKYLLDKMNLSYKETDILLQPQKRKEMIERSGRFTVPQIFINDNSIGGHDELVRLIETGQLSAHLNNAEQNASAKLNINQGLHNGA